MSLRLDEVLAGHFCFLEEHVSEEEDSEVVFPKASLDDVEPA